MSILPHIWYRHSSLSLFQRCIYIILIPFSYLYGISLRFRYILYFLHVLCPKHVDAKVISVGNLTVGGTGKTPVVVYLASYYRQHGYKVVVVTRGYGRTSKDLLAIEPHIDFLPVVEMVGDEALFIAKKTKVPVVVYHDRLRAARFACEKFSPDILIMDDGFQHLRLYRDQNIVVVSAKDPFGNGRLLPAGPLREPKRRIKKADLLWFHHGDGVEPELFSELKGLPHVAKIHSIFHAHSLFLMQNKHEVQSTAWLNGKSVIAFAGIGRPEHFFSTLASLGTKIVKTMVYPDHHRYMVAELKYLQKQKKKLKAELIITTEKDGLNFPRKQCDVSNLWVLQGSVRLSPENAYEKLSLK